MQYSRTIGTEQDLQSDRQKTQQLARELGALQLRSPIRGSVVSPRPEDLLGSRLNAGVAAVEIADLSTLRARLYVSEAEIRDVRVGQKVSLRPDSGFRSTAGMVTEIALASSGIEAGLEPQSKYKGLVPPRYYVVTVQEANSEAALMDGMTGTAKIKTMRRSFAGRAWRTANDFVKRKLW